MINLKNIYNEMMEAIENMSDEEMINEMTKEGCIYLKDNHDTSIRLSTGKIYSNEQYESKRKKILNTKLP